MTDIIDMTNPAASPAVADILRERTRQFEKGWSIEHDDTHNGVEWSWIIQQRTNDMLDPASDDENDHRLLTEIAAIALAGIQAYYRRHALDATGGIDPDYSNSAE